MEEGVGLRMIYPTRYPKCPVMRRKMARGDITIRKEVRPCMIFEFLSGGPFDGGEREETWSKGLWHRWIKQKNIDSVYVRPGKYKKVMQDVAYALIERQDGRVELIEASRVKFIDNPFAEYDWPEEKSPEDKVWDDIREGKGIPREI